MGSTVPKELWIFKNGEASLMNGSLLSSNAVFTNGVIKIGGSGAVGTLNISGIDFTKYKTLNIECRAVAQSTDKNYYVGYGKTTGSYSGVYTAFKNADTTYSVQSFDIKSLGTGYYIKGTSYSTGSTYMHIKNIWLS